MPASHTDKQHTAHSAIATPAAPAARAARATLPAFTSAGLPTVLLLAAGRGERFRASGAAVHKLQALLHGKTVLAHTLAAVIATDLPYYVVTANGSERLGMGDSIARGVAATPNAAGWLVLPADLPMIAPATIQAVASALAASGAAVVQPRILGQVAHPVAFSPACRAALLALAGRHSDEGAWCVVQHYHALGLVQTIVLADEGALQDIDTVDDLARLSAQLRARLSVQSSDQPQRQNL